MSPDQKKFTEKWLSVVTIALLSLFALLVTYFVINELRLYQFGQSNNPPELVTETPLTTDEVDSQRSQLPVNQVTFSGAATTSVSTSTSKDSTSAPEPVLFQKAAEVALAAGLESVALPVEEPGRLTLNQVYGRPDSGVTLKNFAIVPTEKDPERYKEIIQGFIIDKDDSGEHLVVGVSGGRVRVVSLDQSGRTIINGRTMQPADLQIGDEVRVEGFTTGPSDVISAAIIAVVGVTELINTP